PGPKAGAVAVERLQGIAHRTPHEINRIDQPVQVEQACRLTRVPLVRAIMTVPVIAQAQVQDELPADAPVVLHEEAEVDHARPEYRLTAIKQHRGRIIPHQILQGLIRDLPALRVRRPALHEMEIAAKLPGVRSPDQRELLFQRPARNLAPITRLPIKTWHTRYCDYR